MDVPPGDDSGSGSLVCDDLFGGAPGYHLCAETPAACEFYTESGGDSCDVICAEFDAACVGAWDADAPELCVQTNEDDCTSERGDIVCVCARPPP